MTKSLRVKIKYSDSCSGGHGLTGSPVATWKTSSHGSKDLFPHLSDASARTIDARFLFTYLCSGKANEGSECKITSTGTEDNRTARRKSITHRPRPVSERRNRKWIERRRESEDDGRY